MKNYHWELAHELANVIRYANAIANLHGLVPDSTGNYTMTGVPAYDDEINAAYDTEILGIEIEYAGRSIIRIMKLVEERLEYETEQIEQIDETYPLPSPEDLEATEWAEIRREKARYRAGLD